MLKLGAQILDRQKKQISFRVFAWNKNKVGVTVKTGPAKKYFPMTQEQPHIYHTTIETSDFPLLYKFSIDGEEFPDPYSCFQPFGVHGYSQLVNQAAFPWTDSCWRGRKQEDLIIMEIHPGTFTPAGTFRGIAGRLDYLADLGITALELMPVTQTPGKWNWGYDGVNLFSVNHNYGTPDDLKFLVNSCHQKNLAVILDVVYNHFGPEGNYLSRFGPYFTEKHQTPWGPAVNFDDRYSKFTRQMVLDNVIYWLEVFHFDGLRLDAVHAIKDDSPTHILQEISAAVRDLGVKQGREIVLIAESDENNTRLINPPDAGGFGVHAQWMDDFHHCIHTVLTEERDGYYMDYGSIKDLEKVFQNFLYTGQHSRYWNKPRGTDARQNPGNQFVVSLQNHDQVGNRAQGDRLSTLVEFPYLKAAAALMFFSPYIPLLFMGEEYGEKRPFLFFTDYQDPGLKKAVSQGRKEEFKQFGWTSVPDPQDPETFFRSKLSSPEKLTEENRLLLNYYQDLIRLRTAHPVLHVPDKNNLEIKVDQTSKVIEIRRWHHQNELTGFFNLNREKVPYPGHSGKEIFNSSWPKYGGKEIQPGKYLNPGQVIILESKI